MASSTDFIDFVLDQLAHWRRVHTKSMFGCIGLYAEGLMFGVINEDKVHFKVDDTNKKQYIDVNAKQLTIFKSNIVVPSFYEVPVDVLENSDQFTAWAEQALEIQIRRNA